MAPRMGLGVCEALARSTGANLSLIRAGFILLSLAYGLGIILYLAVWWYLTTDEKPSRRALLEGRVRQARREARAAMLPSWRTGTGVAFGFLGVVMLAASLDLLDWITPWRAIAIGLALAGLALVATGKVEQERSKR